MPEIVQAAINTGDALVHTDEERKQWIIESAKVLGPQNIARRYISIIVTCIWGLITLNVAALLNIDLFGEGLKLTDMMEFWTKITLTFGGIMAFYYGTHLVRNRK